MLSLKPKPPTDTNDCSPDKLIRASPRIDNEPATGVKGAKPIKLSNDGKVLVIRK